MHLIVGLGNPGRRYQKTRHNVGFTVVDRLASVAGQELHRRAASSLICRIDVQGQEVILAKPQTYMNLSGVAVRELIRECRVELPNCLIVYDEVALPLGKMRFRRGGSAAGQRGMQSIIDYLGTVEIARLRIGVGADLPVSDLSHFVLSRFSSKEREILDEVLDAAVPAVETFIAQGIDKAMARFN